MEGKTMKELRELVAADQELYDRIAVAWQYLSDQTKHQLVTIAEADASEDPEYLAEK